MKHKELPDTAIEAFRKSITKIKDLYKQDKENFFENHRLTRDIYVELLIKQKKTENEYFDELRQRKVQEYDIFRRLPYLAFDRFYTRQEKNFNEFQSFVIYDLYISRSCFRELAELELFSELGICFINCSIDLNRDNQPFETEIKLNSYHPVLRSCYIEGNFSINLSAARSRLTLSDNYFSNSNVYIRSNGFDEISIIRNREIGSIDIISRKTNSNKIVVSATGANELNIHTLNTPHISISSSNIKACAISTNSDVQGSKVEILMNNFGSLTMTRILSSTISILNSNIERFHFKESIPSIAFLFKGNIVGKLILQGNDFKTCSFNLNQTHIDNILSYSNTWNERIKEITKQRQEEYGIKDFTRFITSIKKSHLDQANYKDASIFKKVETYLLLKNKKLSNFSGLVDWIILWVGDFVSDHLTNPGKSFLWLIGAISLFTLTSISLEFPVYPLRDLSVSWDNVLFTVIELISPSFSRSSIVVSNIWVFYAFKLTLYPYLLFQFIMSTRKYTRRW